MKIFSMAELHAGCHGMKCEHEDGCSNRTFFVYMSDDEFGKAKASNNPSRYVNLNKVGTALCEFHLKLMGNKKVKRIKHQPSHDLTEDSNGN